MRIGVLTDTHLAPAGTPSITWHSPLLFDDAGDRYTRALETLERQEPDAIVVLGDLTHFGDPGSFDEFLDRSARAAVPLVAITGNHDVVPDVDGFPRGLDRSAAGVRRGDAAEPSIVLDGIPLLGVGVEPVGGERYRTTSLPHPEGASIVLSHFPVLSLEERCRTLGIRYAGDLVDRAELEEAVRRDDAPTVVLTGHLHLRAAQVGGSIFQFTFGALIEAPFDVAVLDLELGSDHGRLRVEQLGPTVHTPVALAARETRYEFDGTSWMLLG